MKPMMPQEKYLLVRRTRHGSLVTIERKGTKAVIDITDADDMNRLARLLNTARIAWDLQQPPELVGKGWRLVFNFSELEKAMRSWEPLLLPTILQSSTPAESVKMSAIPKTEASMPVTPEARSEVATEISRLSEEIEKLSCRLEAKLAEGDNPVSLKCEAVLSTPAKCYDFSQARKWAACRSWDIMEKEKVGWQEAISKAWNEVRSSCVWS